MVSTKALIGTALIGAGGYYVVSRAGGDSGDKEGEGQGGRPFTPPGQRARPHFSRRKPTVTPTKKDIKLASPDDFSQFSEDNTTGGGNVFELTGNNQSHGLFKKKQLKKLRQGEQIKRGGGFSSGGSSSGIETIDGTKKLVTVRQPDRDEQGRTAWDRRIAKNKADSGTTTKKDKKTSGSSSGDNGDDDSGDDDDDSSYYGYRSYED